MDPTQSSDTGYLNSILSGLSAGVAGGLASLNGYQYDPQTGGYVDPTTGAWYNAYGQPTTQPANNYSVFGGASTISGSTVVLLLVAAVLLFMVIRR